MKMKPAYLLNNLGFILLWLTDKCVSSENNTVTTSSVSVVTSKATATPPITTPQSTLISTTIATVTPTTTVAVTPTTTATITPTPITPTTTTAAATSTATATLQSTIKPTASFTTESETDKRHETSLGGGNTKMPNSRTEDTTATKMDSYSSTIPATTNNMTTTPTVESITTGEPDNTTDTNSINHTIKSSKGSHNVGVGLQSNIIMICGMMTFYYQYSMRML